jgi:putative transposase
MLRTFKYRLWTNRNQERELGIMLDTHRRLYNACLEQRKQAYESEQRSVRYTEQSAWFKQQRADNPYLARINFSSAQATMRRLDKAFQAFFRRVKSGEKPGYPRFKGQDRFSSIAYPAHGDGIRFFGNRLRLQHVGTVRVNQHRPLPANVQIRTVTVTTDAGKWYVEVCCQLPDVAMERSDLPAVGLDVGIESFLTTSDGEFVPNPGYLKTGLPELRRVQRALSRKKKGGANRRKARKQVARLHTRVRNKRNDHRHKTALSLVRRFGFIAVESLNIQGMVRNRRLSRAISDVAWGGFVATLRHKAESAGVEVIEVNPAGTSQHCSGCGQLVPKKLSERQHHCPHCGLTLHRDVNAARNILARAFTASGSGAWVSTEPLGSVTQEAVCL